MKPRPPAPWLPPVLAGASDVGRRPGANEDAFFAGTVAGAGALLAVSDGLGGALAGEVASALAIEGLQHLAEERIAAEPLPPDCRDWIAGAMRELHHRIRREARRPEHRGMGATLTLLWMSGDMACWGHAGDSRLYLWRHGLLRQLSRDHSPVGRLLAEGVLSEKQARRHPHRHLLDQCLGVEGGNFAPDTGCLSLQPGDVFLLCSDGLTDGLWDSDLAAVLRAIGPGTTPADAARLLLAGAKAGQSRDNITVALAHLPSPEPARRESALRRGLRRLIRS